MASITQRSFSLPRSPGNAVVLQNQDWIRRLAIGTDWTRLRLVFQFGFAGPLSSSTCFFALGMCHGIVNGPSKLLSGGTGVHNFIGLINNLFTGAGDNLVYINNAGVSDQFYINNVRPACFQGTTQIGTGANANAIRFTAISDPSYTWRYSQVVDIAKGTPNYTVRWNFIQANQQAFDCFEFEQYQLAQQNTTVTSAFGNAMTLQTDAFAADEAGGNFDAVCAFWYGPGGHSLELYQVSAYRIA